MPHCTSLKSRFPISRAENKSVCDGGAKPIRCKNQEFSERKKHHAERYCCKDNVTKKRAHSSSMDKSTTLIGKLSRTASNDVPTSLPASENTECLAHSSDLIKVGQKFPQI